MARGRPFQPGQSGNPKGKPVGAIAKKTREAQELAAAIVDDPDYLKRLAGRVNAGRAPHMETLLWHYAHGKPKETGTITGALTIRWADE